VPSFVKRRLESLLDNLIWVVVVGVPILLGLIINQFETARRLLPDLSSLGTFIIFSLASLGALVIVFFLARAAYFRVRLSLRRRGGTVEPSAQGVGIDTEGIMLSDGYSVGFPADSVQEYSFTVINESGADITECYVVLDESARRVSDDDEWEMEQIKLIDTPFRWNKSGASQSGRLDIEDRDRASFSLGRSIRYSAMNVQTKKNELIYQFDLTLHDEQEQGGGFGLLLGWFYRLIITIRSKDEHGKRLPDVSYYLCLRPTSSHGPMGGLEMQGHVRRR